MPSTPDTVTAPNSPRRKKRGLWWKVPLLLLVLLVVAAVGNKLYWDWQVANALQSVRDAGYPITAEELNAWYPEPEGMNAADIYLEAFELFEEDEAIENRIPSMYWDRSYPEPEWPPLGGTLSPDVKAACEEYLALNASALNLIHQATEIPESRFDVDLSNHINADLSHLGDLRRAARILTLRARIQADEGNREATAQTILQQIRLSEALKDEPTLISHLVRISILALMLDDLEIARARVALPSDALEGIHDSIKQVSMPIGMLRAFVGERAMSNTTLQDPQAVGAMASTPMTFTGIPQRNRVALIESIGDLVTYSENPIWPFIEPPHRFDVDSRLYSLASIMLLSTDVSVRTSWQIMVYMKVNAVALTAKRYHLDHGYWPSTPADLVPEYLAGLPMDPLSVVNPRDALKPLIFKPAPFGLIVYSVGTDGVDDGGTRYNHEGINFKPGTDITAYAFTNPGIVQPGVEMPADRD